MKTSKSENPKIIVLHGAMESTVFILFILLRRKQVWKGQAAHPNPRGLLGPEPRPDTRPLPSSLMSLTVSPPAVEGSAVKIGLWLWVIHTMQLCHVPVTAKCVYFNSGLGLLNRITKKINVLYDILTVERL